MVTVGSSAAVLVVIEHYPTFGGQALRYAGAFLALLLVQAVRKVRHLRLSWREVGRLALLAATGLAAFNVCYVQAVRHAEPASVGAVIGGVPIVLAVLGPLLARGRPRARVVAAAVVVSGGVALAQGFGGGSAAGLLWALGALVGEVAFSLIAVPVLPRLGPLRVSTYAAGLAAPMLFVAGLAADGSGVLPVPTGGEVLALLWLAVVVTAAAFVLWYVALQRLGADRAGLCAGIAPASTVVAAHLLGTGTPTGADIAGALVVGVGVVVGLRPGRGDEVRDEAVVLDPPAGLDAAGDVDTPRTGGPVGGGDGRGGQAPGQQPLAAETRD
jgi:drug/metabolite transporter (DMT)-like permease